MVYPENLGSNPPFYLYQCNKNSTEMKQIFKSLEWRKQSQFTNVQLIVRNL